MVKELKASSRHLYRDKEGNLLELFLFKPKGKPQYVRIYILNDSMDWGLTYDLDEFNKMVPSRYESANESQKCDQCGKYSGYDFHCKPCKAKRDKELQDISSEIGDWLSKK